MSIPTAEYGYNEPSRGMPGWLKGCLIAFAVFVLLVVLVAWWAYSNLTRIISGAGVQVVEQAVDASDLPAAEKAEVKVELQRFSAAVDEGKVGQAELGKTMEALFKSPLMSIVVIMGIESQYFDESTLTDEEKEAGRLALRRFIHGVTSEDIPQSKVNDLIALISTKNAAGDMTPKEKLTDDELRAFLAAAAKFADDAAIPADVPAVDASDEVKRIIDAALAPPAVTP